MSGTPMSLNLADIRQEYSQRELSPQECDPDAIAQFERWLNEAMSSQVHEPTAMHECSKAMAPDSIQFLKKLLVVFDVPHLPS